MERVSTARSKKLYLLPDIFPQQSPTLLFFTMQANPRLIHYTPLNPVPHNLQLYNRLVTWKETGDEDAMIAEATSFQKGEEPYADAFVSDTTLLNHPISLFSAAFTSLSQSLLPMQPPFTRVACLRRAQSLVAHLQRWMAARKQETCRQEMERIWQSLLSLHITDSANKKLYTQLESTIQMDHLLHAFSAGTIHWNVLTIEQLLHPEVLIPQNIILSTTKK